MFVRLTDPQGNEIGSVTPKAAKRIEACLEACEGVSTALLVEGVLRRFIDAAQLALEEYENSGRPDPNAMETLESILESMQE